MSLPRGASKAEALAFAEDKSDWIRKHLARRAQPVGVKIGGTILFRGVEHAITGADVKRVVAKDGALLVPAQPDMVRPRLKAFFKLAAKADLQKASEFHAGALGRTFSRITLRDTRSRWGSCTAEGNLMYSWRLVMAAPEILNYVAAHEVAHLVELNHSPAFWKIVEELCPDYAEPRNWLRRNGGLLHRYRFDD